ncbi:MAG: alpha-amylase family glycosyl hydrolase [Paludibacteraceae bacterium]|nr:alpha-amylase family glycosyl hydrolase [Paludibacteraceae bacterium]
MKLFKTGFAVAFCSLLLVQGVSAATSYPSRTDFRDESIYFVMTTRFYNGDPSNDTQCWDAQNYNVGDPAWRGDFKGLIEKLDYIKALGFTAVWITPIVTNGSGYDYHGYHALNFSEVDKRYETHTDSEDVLFQDLINAAHARGMKIILDIVLNHTGNFGEENLCKLFTRDWSADQSNINECMIPLTKKDGGRLPDDYLSLEPGFQYKAREVEMKNTDGVNHDTHNYWHHVAKNWDWDDYSRVWGQIAGDCVDLNTENQYVADYLVRCYGEFIKMGVDGFRIDTSGHISRLTFNKNFIPQFKALAEQYKAKRNGGDFFMYGEVCARSRQVIYRDGNINCSPFYYTWKETKSYPWDNTAESWDNLFIKEGEFGTHVNAQSVLQQAKDDAGKGNISQYNSKNALLNGNTYHTPDYSQYSGFSVIDFPMHWSFGSATEAYRIKDEDKYYNDATWNVVYVDSHDYAPDGAPEDQRFAKSQDTWAENLSLMFTFRGIPCIYYGSEIEFKKGKPIDKGPNIALQETGRAYFGGYIKGDITVSDFAEYSNASGNIAATLSHPLSQHIQRLNKIRMAVPALRKGQYSTTGCSGDFAFKRRYTDATTDSYALVTISGNATFTGIENGEYIDCITGDKKTVTNGSLSVSCSGKGNLRVYVLNTTLTPAPGKLGADGKYLYTSSAASIADPKWDGTEEELDERFAEGGTSGGNGGSATPATPCLETEDERCVFFQAPAGWGNSANVYMWIKDTETKLVGAWPGKAATALGGGTFKLVIPDDVTGDETKWKIIWNGTSGQTVDMDFAMRGLYTVTGDKTDKYPASSTSTVTILCADVSTAVNNVALSRMQMYCMGGVLYIDTPEDLEMNLYTATGMLVRHLELHSGVNAVEGLQKGVYIGGGQKVIVY